MEKTTQRRLAAIVSVDVFGFSRLMGVDEVGTLAALRSHRTELIDDKIADHGGRIVKTMGDGLLLEFPSVVDAATCAIEVQEGMVGRNADVAVEQRIVFRVGVHVGDIIIEGEDILGDGVNIAARIEAIAEPGGVAISGRVHDDVRDRLDIEFNDIGEQNLKNIARSVRVWNWMPNGLPKPIDAQPATISNHPPKVAVMPFQNLSDDTDQEYFSDGLTEDIIAALARYRTFPVISRNSTFAYKGKALDMRQLAAELGVRYIVEGSVRKSGDRVRVTARLNDGTSDVNVWAERFDRDLIDIFDLQDEIVQLIAATVEPEMHRAERQRSVDTNAPNLNAWDCYHRGWSKVFEYTKEGNEQAREFFEKAIEQDPAYRAAYTGIAYTHHRDLTAEFADDREGSIQKCLEAARRGVALDAMNSNARVALAQAYMWPDQHDLALAEARKALELNPNNAWALTVHGTLLDSTGDFEGGKHSIDKALELNPQDPRIHISHVLMARAHLNARAYEAAIEWAQRALRHHPGYPNANYVMAASLGHIGRKEEARVALEACEDAQPGFLVKRKTWKPYLDPISNEHILEGIGMVDFRE
jgi:adenylate cyclase